MRREREREGGATSRDLSHSLFIFVTNTSLDWLCDSIHHNYVLSHKSTHVSWITMKCQTGLASSLEPRMMVRAKIAIYDQNDNEVSEQCKQRKCVTTRHMPALIFAESMQINVYEHS